LDRFEGQAMPQIPIASSNDASLQACQALGEAVVRIWGLLSPEVQHHLFEEACAHQQEARTPLAIFLHGKHPRTGASVKASAMIEPDSLGG
jgi:hypothetical protein